MLSSALEQLRELESRYAEAATPRPAGNEHVMYWTGTHLGVAGTSLLIGAGEISEIIETPNTTPIPRTKPWVMGLATHRGGLLPIFSGDALFRGGAYSGRVREYCMVVRRQGLYFGLTLSAVHRHMKFAIEERDMSHPVDPDLARFCLGGFHHKGQFLAVLDIDKLVTDSELVSVSVTTDGDTNEETKS
ncbi:MAG: chemotaxis protein CheW [Parahaliea sp.]